MSLVSFDFVTTLTGHDISLIDTRAYISFVPTRVCVSVAYMLPAGARNARARMISLDHLRLVRKRMGAPMCTPPNCKHQHYGRFIRVLAEATTSSLQRPRNKVHCMLKVTTKLGTYIVVLEDSVSNAVKIFVHQIIQ